MKKIFPAVCLALIISLASCITIEESYTFKSNGSGTMKYTIDMSEMSSLLAMAEEEEGANPMGQDLSFVDIADKLNDIQGISGAEAIEDKEKYLYGLNFKFEDLNALNRALNKILIDDPKAEIHTFFKVTDGVITRTHLMTKDMNTSDLLGDDESSEYAMQIMESMTYRLKFAFKKPVKAIYSSASAEMGGKKNREVVIQANFKELSEDIQTLSTSIVLK
jgi:hypothetical protein